MTDSRSVRRYVILDCRRTKLLQKVLFRCGSSKYVVFTSRSSIGDDSCQVNNTTQRPVSFSTFGNVVDERWEVVASQLSTVIFQFTVVLVELWCACRSIGTCCE